MLQCLQKDWTRWLVRHCIVQCNAQTKSKTAMRLSAVETMTSQNMFRVPGDVLPLGCFTTCKKNRAHQRNMYYKKYTSCFQTAFEPSPSRQDIQKKVSCVFDLNHIKRQPK